MKLGVQVNCYGTTWDDIRASIETMEAGSWDSLWFADHFFPPWGGPKGDRKTEHRTAFEGYTLIAVAAGMTREAQALAAPGDGQYVPQSGAGREDGNDARPGLQGADFIAGARRRLERARARTPYGWDFPSMRERSDRFQEACELIRKLFTADGPVDYNGRYYRLDQAQLSPGCYQEPHIPIMVGGTGERRTLRTLAMHGDIFNFNGWSGRGMSFELYLHKMGVLERHCENVGRDPAEIKHTLLMPLLITDDEATAERFSVGLATPGQQIREHGILHAIEPLFGRRRNPSRWPDLSTTSSSASANSSRPEWTRSCSAPFRDVEGPYSASTRRSSRPSTDPEPRDPHFRKVGPLAVTVPD